MRAREVVDEATGERYRNYRRRCAFWLLRCEWLEARESDGLAASYSASAVDMEAAAVARVAKQHGIPFLAVKAISDELEFPMPPVSRFVTPQGRLRSVARSRAYVAVRPKWWLPTVRLALNSRRASRNLSAALEHLIQEHVATSLSSKEHRL